MTLQNIIKKQKTQFKNIYFTGDIAKKGGKAGGNQSRTQYTWGMGGYDNKLRHKKHITTLEEGVTLNGWRDCSVAKHAEIGDRVNRPALWCWANARCGCLESTNGRQFGLHQNWCCHSSISNGSLGWWLRRTKVSHSLSAFGGRCPMLLCFMRSFIFLNVEVSEWSCNEKVEQKKKWDILLEPRLTRSRGSLGLVGHWIYRAGWDRVCGAVHYEFLSKMTIKPRRVPWYKHLAMMWSIQGAIIIAFSVDLSCVVPAPRKCSTAIRG